MADVAGQIKITYSFVDDDLAQSTKTVALPSGTTMADAQTYATSYKALLEPLSDCAIVRYVVSQEYYDDTFPTGPANSDVEDKGVLKFRHDGGNGGTSTITIPGIMEDKLLTTGVTRKGVWLDLANAAVAAVVSALVTGLAGTAPTNRRGDDLTTLLEAYKQNRGSLKSMQRRG